MESCLQAPGRRASRSALGARVLTSAFVGFRRPGRRFGVKYIDVTHSKPFIFAIISAVAAALFAVSLLKPHVDRLSVTLDVGLSEGAATPETTRFAADMERFLRPADASAVIALLVILAGGLPLATIALIAHHWPWLLGPLGRNATVIWVCLTLQLTNGVLPSFFILLFASEGFNTEILTAIIIAMFYAIINLLAARVWRELLNRLHVSRLARAANATI